MPVPDTLQELENLETRIHRYFAWQLGATGAIALAVIYARRVNLPKGEVMSGTEWLSAALVVSAVVLAVALRHRRLLDDARERFELRQRRRSAEALAEAEPAASRPAWEIAQVRLETYIGENVRQVRAIFIVTVAVMIVGFLLTGYGVVRAFDGKLEPAIVATTAGVLTEFVAATFLLIYRSTMAQAKEYFETLERINRVGMALQILDRIPETAEELKNQTRSELARTIVHASHGGE